MCDYQGVRGIWPSSRSTHQLTRQKIKRRKTSTPAYSRCTNRYQSRTSSYWAETLTQRPERGHRLESTHCVHKTITVKERLTQFAQASDLVAANAMVQRHVRRMYTWKSHNGAHRNQIDFILVQRRWWTSMRKCKSYPGADADSDHTLVGIKFGIKLHKLPKRTSCKSYYFSEPEQYKLEL